MAYIVTHQHIYVLVVTARAVNSARAARNHTTRLRARSYAHRARRRTWRVRARRTGACVYMYARYTRMQHIYGCCYTSTLLDGAIPFPVPAVLLMMH